MDSFSSCAQIVRTHQRATYICTLFAPLPARNYLYALFAFMSEIEQIRLSVSEEMVGLIRLQWWRDAIEKCYTGVTPHHDVLIALSQTIERANIPQSAFEQTLDAYEKDFQTFPFDSISQLETYAKHTLGEFLGFGLKILGCDTQEARDAVLSLAISDTIYTQLRRLPINLSNNWCTLPRDILLKNNIDPEMIFSGTLQSNDLTPVIQELILHARQALIKTRSYQNQASLKALPLFLRAAVLPRLSKQLQEAAPTLYHQPISLSPVRTPLQIGWCGWKQRWLLD
jgi:phytoene synthase